MIRHKGKQRKFTSLLFVKVESVDDKLKDVRGGIGEELLVCLNNLTFLILVVVDDLVVGNFPGIVEILVLNLDIDGTVDDLGLLGDALALLWVVHDLGVHPIEHLLNRFLILILQLLLTHKRVLLDNR